MAMSGEERPHRPISNSPRRDERILPHSKMLSAKNMSTDSERFSSQAVCKVTDSQSYLIGTGFLGHIAIQRGETTCDYYGLFTNNHVLSYEDLVDDAKPIQLELQFNNSDPNLLYKVVIDNLKKRLRFTCVLLDVTFVQFTQEEIRKVQTSSNIKFLKCNPSPMTKEEIDSKLTAMVPGHPNISDHPDSPQNGATGSKIYAKGPLYKCSGFNILHLVSTHYGSSGSPLLVYTSTDTPNQYSAIGIHKGRVSKAREQEPSNIATSMEAVAEAMKKLRISKIPKAELIGKANAVSYDILLEKGLKKRSNASQTRQTEVFSYTSNQVETWFTFTSHGWYWTKENPCDSRPDDFSHLPWISISDLETMLDQDTRKVAEWLKSGNEYYAH
jgi:hypothetical protein